MKGWELADWDQTSNADFVEITGEKQPSKSNFHNLGVGISISEKKNVATNFRPLYIEEP